MQRLEFCPAKFVTFASMFSLTPQKNSQTRTMKKGMIKLYAINSSNLLRYP